MHMPYIIEVTIKGQEGDCAFGHEVGDRIVFDGKSIKGNICYSALMAILPKIFAMRYGTEFPWAKDNGTILNACPDPENPVVFEIRQIKE